MSPFEVNAPSVNGGDEPPVGGAGRGKEARPNIARATGRALLGLVKFTAMMLPELLGGLLGAVIGLVVGVALGVGFTEDLLEGGTWARAGVLALLLPALTALGPPVIGLVAGAVAGPLLALVPHALVLVVLGAREWKDRYVPVWTSLAAIVLPLPFLGAAEGVGPALIVTALVSPLSGAAGFLSGVLWLASRGVLAGRSLRLWWADADASMAITSLTLSAYGATITVCSCVLCCLLPTQPFAVGLALALGLRLGFSEHYRALGWSLVVVNGLHLALIATVLALVAFGG